MTVHERIISALTQYDEKQYQASLKRKGGRHNPSALALYFEALDRAEADSIAADCRFRLVGPHGSRIEAQFLRPRFDGRTQSFQRLTTMTMDHDFPPVMDYARDLPIVNVDALPKGTGARFKMPHFARRFSVDCKIVASRRADISRRLLRSDSRKRSNDNEPDAIPSSRLR